MRGSKRKSCGDSRHLADEHVPSVVIKKADRYVQSKEKPFCPFPFFLCCMFHSAQSIPFLTKKYMSPGSNPRCRYVCTWCVCGLFVRRSKCSKFGSLEVIGLQERNRYRKQKGRSARAGLLPGFERLEVAGCVDRAVRVAV